jgi:hypothetical protein
MMMRHWEELLCEPREGFAVIVEKTWEDCHPSELFDETAYDIQEICDKIDRCELDWFMLRARVMLDGHELGSHTVGGFLYEDAREVLRDGMAEDLIWEALREARGEARRLLGSLSRVLDKEPV